MPLKKASQSKQAADDQRAKDGLWIPQEWNIEHYNTLTEFEKSLLDGTAIKREFDFIEECKLETKQANLIKILEQPPVILEEKEEEEEEITPPSRQTFSGPESSGFKDFSPSENVNGRERSKSQFQPTTRLSLDTRSSPIFPTLRPRSSTRNITPFLEEDLLSVTCIGTNKQDDTWSCGYHVIARIMEDTYDDSKTPHRINQQIVEALESKDGETLTDEESKDENHLESKSDEEGVTDDNFEITKLALFIAYKSDGLSGTLLDLAFNEIDARDRTNDDNWPSIVRIADDAASLDKWDARDSLKKDDYRGLAKKLLDAELYRGDINEITGVNFIDILHSPDHEIHRRVQAFKETITNAMETTFNEHASQGELISRGNMRDRKKDYLLQEPDIINWIRYNEQEEGRPTVKMTIKGSIENHPFPAVTDTLRDIFDKPDHGEETIHFIVNDTHGQTDISTPTSIAYPQLSPSRGSHWTHLIMTVATDDQVSFVHIDSIVNQKFAESGKDALSDFLANAVENARRSVAETIQPQSTESPHDTIGSVDHGLRDRLYTEDYGTVLDTSFLNLQDETPSPSPTIEDSENQPDNDGELLQSALELAEEQRINDEINKYCQNTLDHLLKDYEEALRTKQNFFCSLNFKEHRVACTTNTIEKLTALDFPKANALIEAKVALMAQAKSVRNQLQQELDRQLKSFRPHADDLINQIRRKLEPNEHTPLIHAAAGMAVQCLTDYINELNTKRGTLIVFDSGEWISWLCASGSGLAIPPTIDGLNDKQQRQIKRVYTAFLQAKTEIIDGRLALQPHHIMADRIRGAIPQQKRTDDRTCLHADRRAKENLIVSLQTKAEEFQTQEDVKQFHLLFANQIAKKITRKATSENFSEALGNIPDYLRTNVCTKDQVADLLIERIANYIRNRTKQAPTNAEKAQWKEAIMADQAGLPAISGDSKLNKDQRKHINKAFTTFLQVHMEQAHADPQPTSTGSSDQSAILRACTVRLRDKISSIPRVQQRTQTEAAGEILLDSDQDMEDLAMLLRYGWITPDLYERLTNQRPPAELEDNLSLTETATTKLTTSINELTQAIETCNDDLSEQNFNHLHSTISSTTSVEAPCDDYIQARDDCNSISNPENLNHLDNEKILLKKQQEELVKAKKDYALAEKKCEQIGQFVTRLKCLAMAATGKYVMAAEEETDKARFKWLSCHGDDGIWLAKDAFRGLQEATTHLQIFRVLNNILSGLQTFNKGSFSAYLLHTLYDLLNTPQNDESSENTTYKGMQFDTINQRVTTEFGRLEKFAPSFIEACKTPHIPLDTLQSPLLGNSSTAQDNTPLFNTNKSTVGEAVRNRIGIFGHSTTYNQNITRRNDVTANLATLHPVHRQR